MIWFYLASLVFGSVFVVPLVLGGIGADADVDFDSDVGGGDLDVGGDVDGGLDVDADLDVDSDFDNDAGQIDGAGSVGLVGDVVSSLVSFRSIMLFITFFGLTGTVLTVLQYNVSLVAILAVLMGLFGAVTNSLAFSLLRRTQSSSHETARHFEGRQATVAVPIEPGHRGRIQIDLGGQPQFMVAEGVDPTETFERGHRVVVVNMTNGIAAVTSLRDLGLPGDEFPQIESP